MQIDRLIGTLAAPFVRSEIDETRGGGTFQQTLQQLESGLRDSGFFRPDSSTAERHFQPGQSAGAPPAAPTLAGGNYPRGLPKSHSSPPELPTDDSAALQVASAANDGSSSNSCIPLSAQAVSTPITSDRFYASDAHIAKNVAYMRIHYETERPLGPDMQRTDSARTNTAAAVPKAVFVPSKTSAPLPHVTFTIVNGAGVIALRMPDINETDAETLQARIEAELGEHDTPLETLVINGHTTDFKQGKYHGHRRD